jgi:predicted lipoprotein with Yx(FWY)xxD motif
MNKTLVLFVIALAASVAGVAGTASAAGQSGEAARSTLTIRSSAYGRILFDGRGRALYAFTRDPRGRSVCSGACAAAWPPYIVKRRPAAGPGVRASLLGTTRRADGRLQVTYAGRPLYYYVRDIRAGQVTCQNVFGFGGLWLVMRSNGRVVR